jgi:uncharacterized glyoxalase superfamily protein PhnB
MATKPIPDGFHTLTSHIIVRNASEAIEYYKKAFGAVELGRAPSPDGKLLMHAALRIGDSILMLNDEFPEMKCVSPLSYGGSAVTLTIYTEDVDGVHHRAVAAGGTETMPVQDMFWGDRYGTLRDPYGHNWAIATRKEDVSHEEATRRMEAFKQKA